MERFAFSAGVKKASKKVQIAPWNGGERGFWDPPPELPAWRPLEMMRRQVDTCLPSPGQVQNA